MYHTYIIQSQKTGRYYTGSCHDLDIRIKRHNDGATPLHETWSAIVD